MIPTEDLLFAARNGDLEILQKHEHQLNTCSNLLHYACANSHVDIVKYLLEFGISPNILNSDKNTPLHWCALTDSQVAAKLLIQYGADPRITNKAGKSAITTALQNNHNDLLELLAEAAMNLEEESEE
eukprot:NODE_39_length_35218_cov_0.479655.p35 type:complete len:128 gc:universal NODE_39_length_35218_cov_0.479655:30818-30435(-)